MAQIFPVNVGLTGAQPADALAASLPPAPAPDDLGNLEQENYQLEVNAAISLGFPIATLSSNLSHAALLLGSTRYKDVIGPDGHVYRFGVALRALIVVSSAKIDCALTAPIVAAKVQLNAAEASAQMLVQGYKGQLTLPAWQDFDLDSYSAYMKAVSDIQAKIMGNPDNIAPELLGTSVAVAPTSLSVATALGVVYALQALSHGASLSHALDKFSVDDPQALSAIKLAYAERIGHDERARPTEVIQQDARAALLGFHLGKGVLDW